MTDTVEAIVAEMRREAKFELDHYADRLQSAHDAEVGALRAERDHARAMQAVQRAEHDSVHHRLREAERAVPTNWLDPLLSGPDAVLRGTGGTWGCPDIERLLQAIRKRIVGDRAMEGEDG